MAKLPAPGDIYLASLPQRVPPGHEQHGIRPVVVIARPNGSRFPMVVAVPLTSQRGPWQEAAPHLYPVLPVGSGGLTLDSVALLDHVQGIDERRLQRRMGALADEVFQPIHEGLRRILEA